MTKSLTVWNSHHCFASWWDSFAQRTFSFWTVVVILKWWLKYCYILPPSLVHSLYLNKNIRILCSRLHSSKSNKTFREKNQTSPLTNHLVGGTTVVAHSVNKEMRAGTWMAGKREVRIQIFSASWKVPPLPPLVAVLGIFLNINVLNSEGYSTLLSRHKLWNTYMSYRKGYFHFMSKREKFQWYC